MYKKHAVFLMFSVINSLLLLWGHASNAAMPACMSSNGLGKLVADYDDNNITSAERVPLILIHGIHGTDSTSFTNINGSTSEEKEYFNNFIIYFYQNNLQDKYQLYRFHYLSDDPNGPVTNIADGLLECLDDFIDRHIINDSEFVIVAHSMGGLVARSYLQEKYHQTGSYSGLKGGERVINLITLATPHHGSPGTNSMSRNDLALNAQWLTVMNIASVYFWEKDALLGIPIDIVAHDEPNRSDLRWDNYDNLMNSGNSDMNIWLQGLNNDILYDNKIIAYYGHINPNDSYRLYLADPFLGPSRILAAIDIIASDDHLGLTAANAIMDTGLSYNYPFNDGLVPNGSGKFVGHSLDHRHGPDDDGLFFDYDHADMKDDLPNFSLFNTINDDLTSIYSSADTGNIIAAEYFIDNDPGEGNGVGMSLSGLPSETIEIPNISTANLSIDVHNFYIRMQNSDGLWGTPRKIMFEVTGNKYISAAEYFINSDPGEGNGTPLYALDNNFDSAFEKINGNIYASTLMPGIHTLYIRARDEAGHWGLPREYHIEIREPLYIMGAEYYIDVDPGAGYGITLSPSDGSFSSILENIKGILDTLSLDYGIHALYVSAMDSYYRWGDSSYVSFEILGPPVINDIITGGCLSELCKSTVSVSATDPYSGNLSYTWTPLNGGVVVGSGANVLFDPPDSGPHPCPYQVELEVSSDVSGLETTQVASIYIKKAGDADGNGVVNLMDKLLVRQHYGQLEGDLNWDVRADVTCDGVVNLMDKLKVRQQYGQTDGCVCQ